MFSNGSFSCLAAASGSRRILAAFALLAGVLGTPLATYAQQDPGISSPKGITPVEVANGTAQLKGSVDPQQKLRLVLALRLPHLQEEKQFVDALRTKGSPSFGKFLTAAQWDARFAPSVADEQAVVDWAKSQGLTVTQRYPDRLLVDVEAPAATIEKAFNVKMNQYTLAGSLRFSSDRDPELPANMTAIVQNVQGLNNIRVMHPLGSKANREFPIYAAGPVVGTPASAKGSATAPRPASLRANKSGVSPNITNGAYDPTDIYSSEAYDVQALYNQGHCCNPLGNPNSSPKETSIAIATAGSQAWSDIAGFQSTYPYLAYNMVQVGIDGQSVPCTSGGCDGEGTMDAEWSTAMSNSFGGLGNTSLVVLYDAANSGFGTFDDSYNRIVSDNSTRVMSTSWGCEEVACFDSTDMSTTDGIFMKMVGQGWTLVVAAGDQGASAGCGAADAVQYPASDPNVVAAGGTTLQLDSNGNFVSESDWSGGPDGCGSNDGGGTGGVSAYWSAPSWQSDMGYGNRVVPDLALNADWYNTPQNLFFNGSLGGNGGTSIVAPELAGLFAQFNAYLLTLGDNCANEGGPCAPMGGLVNPMIYYLGQNPGYAPHAPFYDITSGCNDNDVTAYYGLGYYCAAPGFDLATGWGSFNALQLAWGINTYRAGDFGAPVVSYSGPLTNHWYNSDQQISWSVADTSGLSGYSPNGVSGFSQRWNVDAGDPTSEATPGSGNSFYSGPQFPNATTGSLDLSSIGQGCNTAHVRAWDNSGFTSGDTTYGPVCYDTTPPVTKAALSGTYSGGHYVGTVKITLSATDTYSGVASTVYQVDGGSLKAYTSPVDVYAAGSHKITFHSTDKAGNVEATETVTFTNVSSLASTTTSLTTSATTVEKGVHVTFTATVTSATEGTGSVEFKDGTTVIGTVALSSGKALFSTSTLAVGSHTITAEYLGDSSHAASTSAAVKVNIVNASTTKLTTSANPVEPGTQITFTATVTSGSGTPTGNVELKDGTKVLETLSLSSGKVAFKISNLAAGTHSITAYYVGDATHYFSTSPAISEVVK